MVFSFQKKQEQKKKDQSEVNAILKAHFVSARRNFDRELQKAERRYAAENAQSLSISNEILKNQNIRHFFYYLYYIRFQSCIELWSKAIICPIPKDKSKCIYDPLNYRGINLLLSYIVVFLIRG